MPLMSINFFVLIATPAGLLSCSVVPTLEKPNFESYTIEEFLHTLRYGMARIIYSGFNIPLNRANVVRN